MRREKETIERMKHRVKELVENFDDYIQCFDKASIFSGPSLYFHKKVIEVLRTKGISRALKSDQFFEYLYATLASWGLHRMGKTNTKLIDYDEFKKVITSQKERFLNLKNKRITEIDSRTSEITEITKELQGLIENLKVGKGESKIVFSSKTIHHLLPDLVPPIDRQYTLVFFYNSKTPSHIDNCFSEIYPYFISIACQKRDNIRQKVGKGFHTSETKVIDNAIVGYVLAKLKR